MKTGSTPGASKHFQPFLNGLISMIVTGKSCTSLESTLTVHLNMIEPNNDQALSQHDKQGLPKGDQRRYSAETILRTRPKTYRKIVQLLADHNWSAIQISKACRVSEHTVRAIRNVRLKK